MTEPARGDIWRADFGQTEGHEEAYRRPALIVSVDKFNQGPAELVIAVPLTTKGKGMPVHVAVGPPEAGLTQPSFIMCDQIRTIAKERLLKWMGRVSSATLTAVEDNLRILLDL